MYVLSDMPSHGKGGLLEDLKTGEVVQVKKWALHDRVHLNDLQVYLKRKEEEEAGVSLVHVLEYDPRSTKEE